MTAFGKKYGIRCDGCGKISSDESGYYRRPDGTYGNITSQGRGCDHDFCDECEAKNAPEYNCPKCGHKCGW